MKIVAISDVHAKWKNLKIPECDLLISCGDYSFRGERHLVKNFHEWLNAQEAGHIISVQGNHEVEVEKNFQENKELALSVCPAVHFIDEGLIEIEGKKIWCSAITPEFFNWAWNRNRGKEIKRHWDKIPNDIDILITHGPPHGMLDQVRYVDGTAKERVGCHDLWDKVMQLPNLKHHFFGHIHSDHGYKEFNGKHFYNCSICDEQYMPTNPITIVEDV